MCQTVSSVTLQTAVLLQVKEFAQNNQPFSVHDVTRMIRNKVSNGELEIPEAEVSGASFRFNIEHTKVKALFDELWRTGVFDPDFSLSRQYTGMYFEYTPSPVAGATLVPTAVLPPVTAPNINLAAPAPAATPKTNADVSVAARIQQYLVNCKTRNFRPTLRKVQSAIKRDVSTGWSCEKIQDYVESLGYTVVPDPDAVSKAQVVTV